VYCLDVARVHEVSQHATSPLALDDEITGGSLTGHRDGHDISAVPVLSLATPVHE
jgi:hypothetical protein